MSTTSPTLPDDPVAAAAALGPKIAAEAAETERRGRVSDELLTELKRAGLMRMWLPREVGGQALDVPTILRVYEEVARHDGSTGWVTMIGSGTNFLFTAMAREVVHELFGPDPDIVTGGWFAPRGRAVPVDGGYRVTGRWSFASGCEHCDWLLAGCVVDEGGNDDENEGPPTIRMAVFRREDAAIHRTWQTAGLRGTGSHDYETSDLFVPLKHTLDLVNDRSSFGGAYASIPLFSVLASCLGATVLGMARGALDTLIEHARTRRIGDRLVKDLPLVRLRVAEAEAELQAARAFVFTQAERVWNSVEQGNEIAPREGVLMRLATSHAAKVAADVAHAMFLAGGTAALFDDSPLQRFLRDTAAAQQHAMTAYHTFEGLGKLLLDEGQDQV